MVLIVDDLVPTEVPKFETHTRFHPDYKHVRCDCGGIIGAYDRENFTCERCDKRFEPYQLEYDRLLINDKTGWIFPVIMRRD